jgi:acyl-CoA thioesterase I
MGNFSLSSYGAFVFGTLELAAIGALDQGVGAQLRCDKTPLGVKSSMDFNLLSVPRPVEAMRITTFRLACAALLALALAGKVQAQSAPVRIVALGVSNTEGFGVSTWEAYPARLQALLKDRGIAAEVINAGFSGDTTAGMLTRLDAFLLDGTHLLILQPGSNDARYGRSADTAGNVARIRSLMEQRGIPLIVIDNEFLGRLPDTEMQSDGIHYTANGYAILAARVLPLVLAALRR